MTCDDDPNMPGGLKLGAEVNIHGVVKFLGVACSQNNLQSWGMVSSSVLMVLVENSTFKMHEESYSMFHGDSWWCKQKSVVLYLKHLKNGIA